MLLFQAGLSLNKILRTIETIFGILEIDNSFWISNFSLVLVLLGAELHEALLLEILVHHVPTLEVTLQGGVESLSHLQKDKTVNCRTAAAADSPFVLVLHSPLHRLKQTLL